VKFLTTFSITKIVVKDDGPMELAAGVPFKLPLLEFLAERRGTRVGVEFSDVQGDLGLTPDLEDLRLPAGTIFETHLGDILKAFPEHPAGERFRDAGGITLREVEGYPFLVIEAPAVPDPTGNGLARPVVLDFPMLVSWIKENKDALLETMAGIVKEPAGTNDGPAEELESEDLALTREIEAIGVATWDLSVGHGELAGKFVRILDREGAIFRVVYAINETEKAAADAAGLILMDPDEEG